MRRVFTLLLAVMSLNLMAQEDPNELAQPIVEEGQRLYKSEMASWYGTDIFLEQYKDRAKIGGYFSYTDGDYSKCVFFLKDVTPRVIGSISFDTSFNTQTAIVDLNEREFTAEERNLYEIRKTALDRINADTLFKTYENSSLNLIPLISNSERKVYVLSGPKENGVVIFGNDYLLTFDNNNKLLTSRRLHKNIIPINYGKTEDGKKVAETIHSHLPETGDFITATDICTLMLYGRFTDWKQHNVVSKNYLNIWNCETNSLFVIQMSVIEKINKDQKSRKEKRKRDN